LFPGDVVEAVDNEDGLAAGDLIVFVQLLQLLTESIPEQRQVVARERIP
jgi:hypothetical protein